MAWHMEHHIWNTPFKGFLTEEGTDGESELEEKRDEEDIQWYNHY